MTSRPFSQAPPRLRRFTVDEYHTLAEAGIISEDDRVELIEGQIVTMSPTGSRHAACVDRLNQLLSAQVQDAIVRIQSPIRLDEQNEPEPDVALLNPRDDFYADEHPSPDDVQLIVEVAGTSLAFDIDTKAPLYAHHQIEELWIVDLAEARVLVHREPSSDGYATVTPYALSDTITSEAQPDLSLRVEDVLGAI